MHPDTPTISVEVFVDVNPDGSACFIQPPQTCRAYVNVSIAGGPAGAGVTNKFIGYMEGDHTKMIAVTEKVLLVMDKVLERLDRRPLP